MIRSPESGAGPDEPGLPMAGFSEPTTAWFSSAFAAPTAAQTQAWEAINSGDHALVVAPTGSGKTLAAFLAALDGLLTGDEPEDRTQRCRVLYISPLKALAADVQRNLRSPLVGITQAAVARGIPTREVQVGVRTGDTPAAQRRAFATKPPDILITTPESLFLVLTSAAREGLRGVQQVIVDEVHALAGNKRGAHLALSLERLDELTARPVQRIGLSATIRSPEVVADYLAGTRPAVAGGRAVQVVVPAIEKVLAIEVASPVPDLSDIAGTPGVLAPGTSAQDAAGSDLDLSGAAAGRLPGTGRATGHQGASIWPHVTERITDLITAHRATIVFTNSRRGAERLTARINEAHALRLGLTEPDPGAANPAEVAGQSGAATEVPAEAVIARAHHGSMSREERTSIESALKSGRLPAVVATSSLELGIDMGAVDLVIHVGAPPSAASALQRIGRAGHQVGEVSRGVVLPTHRGDLLAAATTTARARAGQIEQIRIPANPLDVLAQQVVAATAVEDRQEADLLAMVRRAAPFRTLPQRVWNGVLDMLSGRYPSEDFAELRPRLVWDRHAGTLTARPGALRLAVTSGGTIPDRGLYGVYLVGEQDPRRGGRRVGELDEEMVFESRVGDTFTLGSSTWRIEDITPDRVLVSPAPGLPGRLPFWKGDAPPRPAELGRAHGAMIRALGDRGAQAPQLDGLDPWARENVLTYLREQQEATGVLPTDRTLVAEHFRDELGDWRIAIHSPYGAGVHAPWALVLSARLRERFGLDAQVMHADDGIVLRLPETSWEDDQGSSRLDLADLLLEPEQVYPLVVATLTSSAHFAGRFREAAARSLLLPRRRPDRRQPLWQQRQRSAQLLSVAGRYSDFPVVLEAVRECVQDDFDIDALTELMRALAGREIRLVEVQTPRPSPFAQSLAFGYIAQFLYEGDAPLAERRAAALTLDPDLLTELLGHGAEVAELLDEGAVAQVEAEVGLRTAATRADDDEALVDLIRRLGPLPTAALAQRCSAPEQVPQWLAGLSDSRRVLGVRVAGQEQWVVVEDAARVRDGLGVALPPGLPTELTEPAPQALVDLVRRHGRTHGPFRAGEVAERFGLGVAAVLPVLEHLTAQGLLTRGTLRPAGSHTPASAAMSGPDYCDVQVLRRIRRRSLAALRSEVEPVPAAALGVFAPRWHQIGRLRGLDGVLSAVEQLAGTPIAASAWESLVLPARVSDYTPAMLDDLTGSGDVVWVGAGAGPGQDGMVALVPADAVPELAPPPDDDAADTPVHRAILAALTGTGGVFFRDLLATVRAHTEDGEDSGPVAADDVLTALWDLVWAGHVTNDSLAPLRVRMSAAPRPGTAVAARARPRSLRATALRSRVTAATPPSATGRWSMVEPRAEAARADVARVLSLVDRDGVLTRGSVGTRVTGGFSAAYRVLAGAEENGQIRRGYFVEGLGAAQFALPECVERLRADAAEVERSPGHAVLLAATDPANPYGAALAWPPGIGAEDSGHRPGRKVGASVVLVDGQVVFYLERGARSLLSFTDSVPALTTAVVELVRAARAGALGRFTVHRIDGADALTAATPVAQALREGGFIATPRGLRLRSEGPGGSRARG